MKNYIDDKFYNLIKEFKEKTYTQLYDNMVYKFNLLSEQLKDSIQSFLNKFEFWGKIDYKNNLYGVFEDKAFVFKFHYKDFVWLYNKLGDQKSKFILFAVLNNFYNFDFVSLTYIQEKLFKQYFDLDLVKQNNNIFVDIGAFIGDTTLDYINSYGNFKKIYCYDITKKILNVAKTRLQNYKNIEYRNFAVSNSSGVVYLKEIAESPSGNSTCNKGSLKVKQTSLDLDIKHKVDCIKMDIEGGEFKAILGAKNHIKIDCPTLLIAVYHGNRDLYRIPKLINSLNKNYNFYLRYNGGNIFATEIDLICVRKR